MFIEILHKEIPVYGLMIASGLILANMIGILYLRYLKYDFNDFIILEAYALMGAFWGAKVLYLIISYKQIHWNLIFIPDYFNSLMQGGFIFYGGMIAGISFIFLAGKIHKINASKYICHLVFLIPFIHAFGRIGCFLVGCCYGISYSGPGNVIYPSNRLAPAGVELFPVQLAEAICLIAISIFLFILILKQAARFALPAYLISYGIVRFILEFLRGDEARGKLLLFSTSQWISLALIIVGIVHSIAIKKMHIFESREKNTQQKTNTT